jgi:hypothetical protein
LLNELLDIAVLFFVLLLVLNLAIVFSPLTPAVLIIAVVVVAIRAIRGARATMPENPECADKTMPENQKRIEQARIAVETGFLSRCAERTRFEIDQGSKTGRSQRTANIAIPL